jgi:hypothetical protein
VAFGRGGQRLGIVAKGFDAGFAVNLPRPGFVYVDGKGHRFVNEMRVKAHMACRLTANYDLRLSAGAVLAIFDEENAPSGPIGHEHVFLQRREARV